MKDDDYKFMSRVTENGEVLTPENIVNDMLDLVKNESYKIESTFLEPSCGNGIFLVKILERKLNTASKLDLNNYDRNIFIAVSSIYAIDTSKVNIERSKRRLVSTIKSGYKDIIGIDIGIEMLETLKIVIDINIIHGDTLTGLREDNKKDIIITNWNMDGDIVEKKDYIFNYLSDPLLCNTISYTHELITFRDLYRIQKKRKQKSNNLFDEL